MIFYVNRVPIVIHPSTPDTPDGDMASAPALICGIIFLVGTSAIIAMCVGMYRQDRPLDKLDYLMYAGLVLILATLTAIGVYCIYRGLV